MSTAKNVSRHVNFFAGGQVSFDVFPILGSLATDFPGKSSQKKSSSEVLWKYTWSVLRCGKSILADYCCQNDQNVIRFFGSLIVRTCFFNPVLPSSFLVGLLSHFTCLLVCKFFCFLEVCWEIAQGLKFLIYFSVLFTCAGMCLCVLIFLLLLLMLLLPCLLSLLLLFLLLLLLLLRGVGLVCRHLARQPTSQCHIMIFEPQLWPPNKTYDTKWLNLNSHLLLKSHIMSYRCTMCHENCRHTVHAVPSFSNSILLPRTGWDKTYCLRYLPEADFDEIHFFGDKTSLVQAQKSPWGTLKRKMFVASQRVCWKVCRSLSSWRFLMFYQVWSRVKPLMIHMLISWLKYVEMLAVMQIVTLRFEGGNDFEIYTHPRTIGHSHRLGDKRSTDVYAGLRHSHGIHMAFTARFWQRLHQESVFHLLPCHATNHTKALMIKIHSQPWKSWVLRAFWQSLCILISKEDQESSKVLELWGGCDDIIDLDWYRYLQLSQCAFMCFPQCEMFVDAAQFSPEL